MLRNISFLFCLLLALQLEGQQLPYYVVIGAYSVEGNAQRATLQAQELNYPAIYGFNTDKKFFYVYIRVSPERDKAVATLRDIRKEGFRDAWVFQGSLQLSPDNPVAISPAPVEKPLPTNNEVIPATNTASIAVTPADVVSIQETIAKSDSIPVEEAEKPAKPAGRGFVFKLINKSTGDPVTGMVRLQESERANQFRPFVSNNLVYVTPPANKAGRWLMVCQVVGFKPLRTFFNYKEAEALEGVTIGNEQEIILPVPLERVKRGDYIELDEVKFFNNSSIMTPESERELRELLAMMTENTEYKIRIHGHTNGTFGRDIVSLGESEDLFHTNSLNKRQAGTAKELSSYRAETVKQYLVTNGIDESRISVKGEGGAQMIFDPKGTLASMNDRVEVEVTKH
jgi:outer membrane protein OmpA-like peptidoglycan-associated protein